MKKKQSEVVRMMMRRRNGCGGKSKYSLVIHESASSFAANDNLGKTGLSPGKKKLCFLSPDERGWWRLREKKREILPASRDEKKLAQLGRRRMPGRVKKKSKCLLFIS